MKYNIYTTHKSNRPGVKGTEEKTMYTTKEIKNTPITETGMVRRNIKSAPITETGMVRRNIKVYTALDSHYPTKLIK